MDKNICSKCGGEWAIVEPFLKIRKVKRKMRPKGKKFFDFSPGQIKSWRAELGISQRDLAILLNVTPWAIISWEKGRSKPRKDKIARLAELAKKGKEEIQKMLSEKIAKE